MYPKVQVTHSRGNIAGILVIQATVKHGGGPCAISSLDRIRASPQSALCGPNEWGTVRPHSVRNSTVQKAIVNSKFGKSNFCCKEGKMKLLVRMVGGDDQKWMGKSIQGKKVELDGRRL
jgi:hypothetical protein